MVVDDRVVMARLRRRGMHISSRGGGSLDRGSRRVNRSVLDGCAVWEDAGVGVTLEELHTWEAVRWYL
jgi:hypothetical protein